MTYIGLPLSRPEDPALLTGAGRFVADLSVEDPLEAVFVRSQEVHGVLRAVDVSAARDVPGIVAAFSARELPDLPSLPSAPWLSLSPSLDRPALARDRVRFVGEPIAVILATSRGAAEDAAERVVADIDPLPHVLDPTEAAASEDPTIFEGMPNVVEERTYGEGVGDAPKEAAVVEEASFRFVRVAHLSLEARGIVAAPRPDGGLTVWCSHQAPHRLKAGLLQALSVEDREVHVVVPFVGGAFGGKSQLYPEYVVACHLALKLGRTIRWIEDRQEAFVGAVHGRGQNTLVRVAADAEGRILALEAEIDGDLGAYPETGALVPTFTGRMLSGPYRIPRMSVRVRGVVTNAPPTAPYRGAGRPEATFVLERAMDGLADRLGVDRAEVRRRNFIPPDAFPYVSGTGAEYDSGRYEGALELALELADYRRLKDDESWHREKGVLRGIGVATYVERSGGESNATEYGAVRLLPGGVLEVLTGSSSHGQGHQTAFAQIAASALEIDPGRVRVVQGDTDAVAAGTGTFGSRSIQVGGAAVHEACRLLIERVLEETAGLVGARPEDLSYSKGRVAVTTGTPHELTLEEVTRHSGPLFTEHVFDSRQAFPFGTYVATVEIDVDTGVVRALRLVAVDDCGVIVNPLLVEGQIHGSIAQGLGQALLEEMVYDEHGQPVTVSLSNYAPPGPVEMPELVLAHTVTPNPNVPLGSKGAGEAGCIGAPPAIVNAVVDALRGYDTESITMPVTPQKVWRALQRPRRAGRTGRFPARL